MALFSFVVLNSIGMHNVASLQRLSDAKRMLLPCVKGELKVALPIER